MKIAICDDCICEGNPIYDIITNHSEIKKSKIDIYSSPTELQQAIINKQTYDIVFLDIEMPIINGMDLSKFIKTQLPEILIIFVTNYPQYAIEAFDCEVDGYLIKPLNIEKTNRTLDRIIIKYRKLCKSSNAYHIIKIQNRRERILIKDIYWVKCEKKHIIYMMKNDNRETVGTLSDAYKALKDYGFYQVHQGYLVNMDKIKKFESYYALLDNGAKVEISVRKRREFLMAYAKYIEENS